MPAEYVLHAFFSRNPSAVGRVEISGTGFQQIFATAFAERAHWHSRRQLVPIHVKDNDRSPSVFKEHSKLLLSLPHCILRTPPSSNTDRLLPLKNSPVIPIPRGAQSSIRLEGLSLRHGKDRFHGTAVLAPRMSPICILMLMAAHAVRSTATDGSVADRVCRRWFRQSLFHVP